ncbi:hypothetical protein GX411_00300 [Candidatus Fermentibacteria bacterium]|nr:hypothetical protein [Candidatus Fermentibacteria bacterium]
MDLINQLHLRHQRSVISSLARRLAAAVEVRGELWWCRSSRRLEPGMEVRVTGVEDMVLTVEPVKAP